MQEFKSIVRSCYKYLGQENLLGGAAEPEFKAKVNIVKILRKQLLTIDLNSCICICNVK
jgi:hypothetical protein